MNLAIQLCDRGETFFEKFEKLADNANEAGELFAQLLKNPDEAGSNMARLKRLEQEAYERKRSIDTKMHLTSVAPLEHSDIYRLAEGLYGIVNLVYSSADRAGIYQIELPAVELKDMAAVLCSAISNIRESVHFLRNKKDYKMILARCHEIRALREKGRDVLCDSLLFLFDNMRDAVELFKRKDILDRLDKAVNKSNDVALILEGVVLKG